MDKSFPCLYLVSISKNLDITLIRGCVVTRPSHGRRGGLKRVHLRVTSASVFTSFEPA